MEQEQVVRPPTVEERIEGLKNMCITVYDELYQQEFFRDEARGYASFDLRMENFIISMALERFEKYADENEKGGDDKKDTG
jgi:hypothetical protein